MEFSEFLEEVVVGSRLVFNQPENVLVLEPEKADKGGSGLDLTDSLPKQVLSLCGPASALAGLAGGVQAGWILQERLRTQSL